MSDISPIDAASAYFGGAAPAPAVSAAPAAAPAAPAADAGIDAASAFFGGGQSGASSDPDGFFDKAIVGQESNGQQFDKDGKVLTSKKGAIGAGQVMPETGPEAAQLAGMPWDPIRFRTDRDYNLALGKAYFKKQHADFGDLGMASAAYNAGPGALRAAKKAAAAAGKPDAWLDFLPHETRDYVPSVMKRAGAAGSTQAQAQPVASPFAKDPAAPAQDRTWGEAAADTGLGVASGLAGLAKTGGELAGLVTGDMDNVTTRVSDAVQKYLEGQQSEALKGKRDARDKDVAEQDGILSKAWTAFADSVSDPALAMDLLASNAATVLPGAVVGRAAAAYTGGRAMLAAMEAGPVSLAARQAIAKSAAEVGVWTGTGASAVQQGADVAQQAFDDAMEKKPEVWAANPEFAQRVKAGENPEQVKRELALRSAREAFTPAAAISLFANGVVGGNVVERALVGGAAREGKHALSGGLVRRVAAGGAKEAGTEFIEEGGGQLAANVANQRNVDANQDLSHNVGENAGLGAAGGFVQGAPAGAFHHGEKAPDPAANPALTPALQQLADNPGNSPLSAAAVAGNTHPFAQQQADAQAQAAANQPEDPKVVAERAKADKAAALSARAAELEAALREPGVMDTFRAEGSDFKNSKIVADMALAKAPSASPASREQAISRLEYALEFAGGKVKPQAAQAAPAPAVQPTPEAQGANEAAAARAAQLAEEEGQHTEPVSRTVEAAEDRRPSQANEQAAARVQQVQQEEAAPPVVDQKPAAVSDNAGSGSRVSVNATPVAPMAGAGSAVHRKRRATLRQILNMGMHRVERKDDGSFVLTDGKREFQLEGPADAQLARNELSSLVAEQAGIANMEPSERQKKAGNYKKGRVAFDGLKLGIENPVGSTRSGTSPDGTTWTTPMELAHYGDVTGTKSADGDAVDFYLAKHPHAGAPVFVFSQHNLDGSFDEPKAVGGVRTLAEATRIYDAGFTDGSGPKRRQAVKQMSMDEFKAALERHEFAKKPKVKSDGNTGSAAQPNPAGRDERRSAQPARGVDGGGVRDDGSDAWARDRVAQLFGGRNVPPELVRAEGGRVFLKIEGREIELVDRPDLGMSEVRGDGKKKTVAGNIASLIEMVGKTLGQQVVWYRGDFGDGFTLSKLMPDVLFLNNKMSDKLDPVAVFGHEFWHNLKAIDPKLHAAVSAVVAARIKKGGADTFRAYYNKDMGGKPGEALNAAELEEMVSDLGGNFMAEGSFWSEVMSEIQDKHPEQSRSLVAKLAAFLGRMFDSMMAAVRGDAFATEHMVDDLHKIRGAFRDALVDFMSKNDVRQAALQAQVLRENQAATQSTFRDLFNLGRKEAAQETAAAPAAAPAPAEGTTVTRSTGGVNMRRLTGLLGPQLYGDMANMGPVTVKELFQNAFDALKGMVQSGEGENHRVDIRLDKDARTIEVSDNGSGMTPEIINKAFLTIAGTNKETDRSSGGFGVAKMLFLYGAKRVELITTRDGKTSMMDFTGEQLLAATDDKSMSPDITTVDNGDKSGTMVRITLPEDFADPSTGERRAIEFPREYVITTMVDKSPLFEPITVAVNGFERNVGARFPQDNFTVFSNVKFAWGQARIIISKQEEKQYDSNVGVLSNGLWQFSTSVKENPMDPYSDSIPRRIYINVEPKVKPEEHGYPFALNRQDFSPAVKEDFGKILKYLSVLYGGSKAAESAAGFGQIEYLSAGGAVSKPMQLAPAIDKESHKSMLHINAGDAIEVVDGRMLVNGREVPELTRDQIEKVKINVAKFKIDQSLVDPSRPIVHDNLDVKEPGPKRRAYQKLVDEMELLDVKRTALEKESEELYEQVKAEDKWGGELYERMVKAREAHSQANDRYWQLYDEKTKARDAMHEAGDEPEQKLPITTVMRERHGKEFNRFTLGIGNVFMDVRDTLVKLGGSQYEKLANVPVGVSFDQNYYGVHIWVPFQGMMVNPGITRLDDEGGDHKPRAVAVTMLGTMIHEVAHYTQKGHDADFVGEMQRLVAILNSTDEDNNFADLAKRLTKVIERYKDVYADLNKTLRGSSVENRGVKLSEPSYDGGPGEPAQKLAGERAAGQDDGRVARDADQGAEDRAAGQDPAGVRQSPERPGDLKHVSWQEMEAALEGVRKAIPNARIEVHDAPADAGLEGPPADVDTPMGVTLRDGRIVLFRKGLADPLEVQKTAFHELFHRGVRRMVPDGDYHDIMDVLYDSDEEVQRRAHAWGRTQEAVERKAGGMSNRDLRSLAIEEGLAEIAEDLMTQPADTVAAIKDWVAGLAKVMGLSKLASWLRTAESDQTVRFIQQALKEAGRSDAPDVKLSPARAAEPRRISDADARELAKLRREVAVLAKLKECVG